MKPPIFAALAILSLPLLPSCASSGRGVVEGSKPLWPAFDLAADGNFKEARRAVERGDDSSRHYREGVDYHMMSTLSPKLYDRWSGHGRVSSCDFFGADSGVEYWAERAGL